MTLTLSDLVIIGIVGAVSAAVLDLIWYTLIMKLTTGHWIWYREKSFEDGGTLVSVDQFGKKGRYVMGLKFDPLSVLGFANSGRLENENRRLKNRIEQLEKEEKEKRKKLK